MAEKDCVYKTSREIKVSVPAQDLINTLLDDIIGERVSDMVAEDHDGNGIVIPGSVKLISRTPLFHDLTRFDGAYACHARYVADCYDAPKGMTTTAVVRVTLPNGILCEKEMPEMRHPVFRIFLPYEVHNDATRDRMRTLIRDQVVRFRSIQRYGGLGDNTIDVLGEFIDTVGDIPVTSNPASGVSAQLRGRDSLRVEDFQAPRGADSDDPAVVQQHRAEMGEGEPSDAGAASGEDEAGGPSSKPPSAAPSALATDESGMYDLWLKYNVALAKTHEREAADFGASLIASIQTLGDTKSMWYDPVNRRFTAYLKGLDAPAAYPYYLYRALPNDNIGSIRGILPVEPADYTPVAEYSFVVTNPNTLKIPRTTDILQNAVPRRLYGVVPRDVLILSFMENPRIAFEPMNVASIDSLSTGTGRVTSHTVRITTHKLASGTPVGEQLTALLKDMYDTEDIPDLIVLDARQSYDVDGEEESKSLGEDPQVVLDAFIPTYPLVIDTSVLVFTPSHATQCKGNYVTAKSPMDTLLALLGCAATELGGHIQRPPGSAGSVVVRPEKSLAMRVVPVVPDAVRMIPTIEHGWMSLDTHSALVGAMRSLRPSSVFELGSWYGLSTRVILGESSGTTLYAFDKFKAPPVINYDMKRLKVEDNFFLNHPRYETFAANVSTAMTGLGMPSGAAAAAAGSGSSSSRNKVFMIKGDASKVVTFATTKRIAPELVFIDFEKNTARLKSLIKNLRTTFPHVVIVGDDLIFDSVKRAVRSLPKKNTIVFEESYIVLPNDFPADAKASLEESIAAAREELADTEKQTTVREYIKDGRIGDVLRAYPAGESITTVLPHTQAQMSLHEALRVAKNKHPDAITDEVIRELLDDSQHWTSGSANFATLTPWDYIAHKLSFFKGEDETE